MSEITSILDEKRSFAPPSEFQNSAKINSMVEYDKLWKYSVENPEDFWRTQANEKLHWHKPFSKVLDWQPPHAKWFEDGEMNVSYNCLDRHLEKRGDKPAIIWEGEPGDSRTITYKELHKDVCTFANVLIEQGINAGDRVTIYMPMVPEAAVAMLACTRIGAVHNVVFGGFSADAIAERNQDAQAKMIITADGGWRRGQIVELKKQVDLSLERSPTVEKVIVLKRTKQDVDMKEGQDFWWHDLTAKAQDTHEAQGFSAEHPMFILYTSGSTGKPKGILHTSGGYLLGATLTSEYVFDLKEDDIYWCTADVGWITGHSYIVYGPMSNGATVFMYEGAPMQPQPDRFWQLIEKYKISIFYTAPTAVRAFIKCGNEWPEKRDLSSLRLLGTVGEPINPEAWMWYKKVIGGDKCPIVDTWWQTETGSMMITPLPGATSTIPGSATRPFFGVDPAIVDEDGNEVEADKGGFLVIRKPWPSMLRTIYGDPKRFQETYFGKFGKWYFTGDGARKDENGNFWIMGRVDDVLNVSGHRLSTMEIESALVSHSKVAEAAVVSRPHDLKGECIVCFVTLEGGQVGDDSVGDELKAHVAKNIGAIARPEEIRFADALPKTRSGKIMRRLLRDIAAGRECNQDTTTLEDRNVLESLRT